MGKLSQNLLIEKDEFVYRSYLALGQYNILTSEIKDNESTPLSLKCIKLLCNYIMCNNKTVDTSAEKQQIIVTLLGYEAEAAKTNCKAFYIVYATILLYEDNNKDALKQVFYSNTLEQ